ncbi:hypothetical protein ACFLU6_16355, partial [Acidobacteriota bacterium]
FGMAYNASVWWECRYFALEFLKEAKDRLDKAPASHFDEAIGHYDIVARELKKVEELFPFFNRKPGHIEDASRRSKAVDCIRKARSHEESGLEALGWVLSEIQ